MLSRVRLKGWSVSAAAVAAPAISPAMPVVASVVAATVARPTRVAATSAAPDSSPPLPSPAPTAPPAAPAAAAMPAAFQSCAVMSSRWPIPTCRYLVPISRPPSSIASKIAPYKAARAAALAAARVSMRAINCLIAIRMVIWVATRRATAPAALIPVHAVASNGAISSAKMTMVPMMTSLVCSISAAPSPIWSAILSRYLTRLVQAPFWPVSWSQYAAIASCVWPSIAANAWATTCPASSSSSLSAEAISDHASDTRRIAVSSPSGQSPAPTIHLATHCRESGISIPIRVGFGSDRPRWLRRGSAAYSPPRPCGRPGCPSLC
ncbi:hypothetical protein NONI108955_24270 [Nocardia ninae]